MENKTLDPWKNSSWLSVLNQSYIENLYNFFLVDPSSVTNTWRIIFNTISKNKIKKIDMQYKTNILYDQNINNCNKTVNKDQLYIKHIKILKLIDEFRKNGHKIAKIDPLNLFTVADIPTLQPHFYNLASEDLRDFSILNKIIKNKENYITSYQHLKKIYAGSIGFEYMHISNTDEKEWIQNYIESTGQNNILNKKQQYRILKKLTHAEILEKFLAIKFPGAKRFSLEGSETLIPMLDFLISHATTLQISDIFFGMAHRGRLNVLVNIFEKKARFLFQEFLLLNDHSLNSGDVKYHMGYESTINNNKVNLKLKYNPSHLEIINPVVMGSARAHIDALNSMDVNSILSVMIHGDAAISGQGVIQETLNMSQVPGYNIGGSIHLVINNQIGFTTSNKIDLRSSYYCTDIAKMIESPVFHVNSDDP
ncbi:MAG TPA: thiamine pyrophosphate-dependent enzyme, partial [Buchnera sp. (in: enterobacteria)]|nr:thiamine pyrophosphate-dependent enzyme [Buchnera sp. (in: enterobacteria)]